MLQSGCPCRFQHWSVHVTVRLSLSFPILECIHITFRLSLSLPALGCTCHSQVVLVASNTVVYISEGVLVASNIGVCISQSGCPCRLKHWSVHVTVRLSLSLETLERTCHSQVVLVASNIGMYMSQSGCPCRLKHWSVHVKSGCP